MSAWLHFSFLCEIQSFVIGTSFCVVTVGCDVCIRLGWWLPFSWAWWWQRQRNAPHNWKSANSRVWRVPSTIWAPTTWRVAVPSRAALCPESVGFPFCISATARLPSGEYLTEPLFLLLLLDGTFWTMCGCAGSASYPLRRNLISQCQCLQHSHRWQVQRQQHLTTFMSFLRRERYWKSFSSALLYHRERRPVLLWETSRWEICVWVNGRPCYVQGLVICVFSIVRVLSFRVLKMQT